MEGLASILIIFSVIIILAAIPMVIFAMLMGECYERILIIFSVIIILAAIPMVIFAMSMGECYESKRYENMPDWGYLLGVSLILVICGVASLLTGIDEMKKKNVRRR